MDSRQVTWVTSQMASATGGDVRDRRLKSRQRGKSMFSYKYSVKMGRVSQTISFDKENSDLPCSYIRYQILGHKKTARGKKPNA